jgi:hypothetical protein
LAAINKQGDEVSYQHLLDTSNPALLIKRCFPSLSDRPCLVVGCTVLHGPVFRHPHHHNGRQGQGMRRRLGSRTRYRQRPLEAARLGSRCVPASSPGIWYPVLLTLCTLRILLQTLPSGATTSTSTPALEPSQVSSSTRRTRLPLINPHPDSPALDWPAGGVTTPRRGSACPTSLSLSKALAAGSTRTRLCSPSCL